MARTLYSPRLSDPVVRALYREGQRRGIPMTRLADELILSALGQQRSETPPAGGTPTPAASRGAAGGTSA